jgi:ribonuclease Z
MKPLFHPVLVNGPFEDPGVFIDCLFERRALLFDLGDLQRLAPRKLLRLTDVFVSHTHMDHFMGFDWLLRLTLGRGKTLRLYGPRGFLAQVEHRLLAYTWNLVDGYDQDLVFEVMELLPDDSARRATFRCRAAFRREREEALTLHDGVLRDEENFCVRVTHLDHRIDVLAFMLEEKAHLNVWKNRLDEMGLPTGAWLQELKRAVRRGEPDDYPLQLRWREGGQERLRCLPLGELRARVLQMVPGQRIGYVTDAVYDAANAQRILALTHDADVLFIEAPFLERDAARAAQRYHLTAHQAGTLAREARVKAVVPFHFSPRYEDEGAQVLRDELMQAFVGDSTTPTAGSGTCDSPCRGTGCRVP